MEQFPKIFEDFNISQTLVILILFWFFYNRIAKKLDKIIGKSSELKEI